VAIEYDAWHRSRALICYAAVLKLRCSRELTAAKMRLLGYALAM
jgi:hypothetical protein